MDLSRRIGLSRQPAHSGDALAGSEEGEDIQAGCRRQVREGRATPTCGQLACGDCACKSCQD